MTRIIAGRFGGQRLRTPKSSATRPTSDRVREAIFSRLQGWGVLQDAMVLDLYAGSGALGFEALSRGAARATFVESHAGTVALIRQNADDLQVSGAVTVRQSSAENFGGGQSGAEFSVLFLDPPYHLPTDTINHLLNRLVPDQLAADATIVVERSKRSTPIVWPAGVEDQGEKLYGETVVYFGAYFDPVSGPGAIPDQGSVAGTSAGASAVTGAHVEATESVE